MQRIRQILVNNNYSNTEFDKQAEILIGKHMLDTPRTPDNKIYVYYKNTFTNAYRKDEKVIKDIIAANCTPVDDTKSLKVQIYYNSPTTSSLLIRNNLYSNKDKLATPDVVYKYSCNTGDCAPQAVDYVGYTTCTLSRRLTNHLQAGAIKQHHLQHHGTPLTREDLVNNTNILTRCKDHRKLAILESVFIKSTHPKINIQMNVISRFALFDETTGRQQTSLQDTNRSNLPNSTNSQFPSPPLTRSATLRTS